MLKIYDCSNSINRPHHRGNGGPIENTIVRDLKKYAHLYNCAFVDSISDADVGFTNDVFTDEVLLSNKPLVKRMDGVFFQESLLERNVSLNCAARQANLVIFISEFSKQAYYHLYGKYKPIKNNVVILNWVDQSVFKFKQRSGQPKKFIAIATSWDRPEKRIEGIIKLVKANPNLEFYTIGKISENIPKLDNLVHLGYMEEDSAIAETMNEMDAMICTAFRDAAPKTVAQGIACGLPCFYANSGGVPELVGNYGLSFGSTDVHTFYDKIPNVSDNICNKFDEFCLDYDNYVKNIKYDENRYSKVLFEYFDAINSVA